MQFGKVHLSQVCFSRVGGEQTKIVALEPKGAWGFLVTMFYIFSFVCHRCCFETAQLFLMLFQNNNVKVNPAEKKETAHSDHSIRTWRTATTWPETACCLVFYQSHGFPVLIGTPHRCRSCGIHLGGPLITAVMRRSRFLSLPVFVTEEDSGEIAAVNKKRPRAALHLKVSHHNLCPDTTLDKQN